MRQRPAPATRRLMHARARRNDKMRAVHATIRLAEDVTGTGMAPIPDLLLRHCSRINAPFRCLALRSGMSYLVLLFPLLRRFCLLLALPRIPVRSSFAPLPLHHRGRGAGPSYEEASSPARCTSRCGGCVRSLCVVLLTTVVPCSGPSHAHRT